MGEIAIIEGSACGHQPRPDGRVVVRIAARSGRFVHHQLMRAVLPAIRRAIAEPAFAALVAPSKPALSIVFGGLMEALSDGERRKARSLSARLTSHLTHNVPMQELLWDAYARFLVAANRVAPMVIVIEDLGQLDVSSFAILLQLFRLGVEQAPDVVVGYTAELPELVELDDRGLFWDIAITDLRRSVGALRRLPSRTEHSNGDPSRPCSCPIDRDPWDLSPEATVAQLLARPVLELTPTSAIPVVVAIQQVFASFAFDTALRLALGVLDAGLPLLPPEHARLCGVAATSAHNRQFFSQGNHRIAGFLRDTYRAALANEMEPEYRICLYYRLAVTYCRRLGELEHARRTVEAGLAELAGTELSVQAMCMQEAWLRSIDALVHVRRGNLAAAFVCCDQSYTALAEVTEPEHASAAEVELSKIVMGENALTLASMTGNEALRDLWLARAREGLTIWPSLTVVNVLEQQRMHIDRLEIAQARDLGVGALDLARAKLNPLLEYFVLVGLSDLAFRLADYDAAADYGDAARALGPEVGDLHGTQLALELRAAEICEARGRLDEAERLLHGLIASDAAVELRADVWGRLACLYARRGERERALQLIEQTIDLAAETGELDLILRASCCAGEVGQLLEMSEDAQAAYANCFELLEGADVRSTAAREILRLRAVVGQARSGQPDPSQLAACLSRLPRLLAQERDAWPLARALVGPALRNGAMQAESEAALRIVSAALAVPGAITASGASADPAPAVAR